MREDFGIAIDSVVGDSCGCDPLIIPSAKVSAGRPSACVNTAKDCLPNLQLSDHAQMHIFHLESRRKT
jgi:hypothetical protein